jgi:hypothetical protein
MFREGGSIGPEQADFKAPEQAGQETTQQKPTESKIKKILRKAALWGALGGAATGGAMPAEGGDKWRMAERAVDRAVDVYDIHSRRQESRDREAERVHRDHTYENIETGRNQRDVTINDRRMETEDNRIQADKEIRQLEVAAEMGRTAAETGAEDITASAKGRHIPDCHLGSHRAECYDMSHLVVAIFVHNIFEHCLPAILIEVNIYIGHRNTVDVQETFEKKAIFDWIYVCYPETVSYS